MSAADGSIPAAACTAGRTVADPQLSPDGHTVAFLSMGSGPTQLILIDAAGGPERVLPTEVAPSRTHPMAGGVFSWSVDGASIAYCGADGTLWLQPVDGSRSRAIFAAPPDTSLTGPCFSPDGQRVAVVVDERSIMVISLDGHEAVAVASPTDFVFDPAWLDPTTLVWHGWSVPDMPWDHSVVWVASADGSSPARPLIDHPGAQVTQPRPKDGQLAYLSDATGWLNLWVGDRVMVAESFEHGGPTWGPGLRSFAWSPDGRRVAFCRNEGGFGRLCVVDVGTGAVLEAARAVHAAISWQGDRLVALRTGGITPAVIVSYNVDTWERTVLARGPAIGVERGAVEPERVTYRGHDGFELHARLYQTPAAVAPRMLCWIHGGPTDQWPVTFNSRIAYFVSRGWNVLVPDHRGSTGHGRAYTQALRGRWGELDVADVEAALAAAHQRGWAPPSRSAVIGGSAGGFTALNVAAHAPEQVAAIVALYPVTDLLQLAATTHRFEAHYCDGLVGVLPEARDGYRERSVLFQSKRIVAPLLLLHGDDDKVVPVAQSSALAERITADGGDVALHIYPGEGHGWKRPDTVMDELHRVEAFLDRYIPWES